MKLGVDDLMDNGLKISVDWLSWTLPYGSTVEEVVDMMGYSVQDFQRLPRGRNGYKSQFHHSAYSISIQYDGQDSMGIHVDVSGSAIQDLMQHYHKRHSFLTPFGGVAYEVTEFGATVFADLLKEICIQGHLTRLDLAVDDFGACYYTLPALDDKLSSKCYVSKFRHWKKMVESENSGSVSGYTIYLGSGSSSIMFRVYDKQLEQNKKLEAASQPLLTQPWVRWELELKAERAQQASVALIQGMSVMEVTVGVLTNYFRIVCRDSSRNSLCTIDPLWELFVGDILKLRLYQSPKVKTIEDTKNWLERQVSASLASVVIAEGGDSDFIYHLLHIGSMRLSNHHRDMINEYAGGCYDNK